MSGFVCVRKSTQHLHYGAHFEQKTTHFTTTGSTHGLAVDRAQFIDHAECHAMARAFNILLKFFQRTHGD